MATRTDTVCAICANESWQTSKDGGETWECSLCMGVFNDETGERVA